VDVHVEIRQLIGFLEIQVVHPKTWLGCEHIPRSFLSLYSWFTCRRGKKARPRYNWPSFIVWHIS
jgi:hypothetical protein